MAAAVLIRTLYAHLGFYAGSATTITDDQGIYNLGKLKLLHNNYCENMCKYIRRPGEKIVGQGGVDIPKPGIPVSLRAAMKLTLTTYYLWHLDKISRNIGMANITLPVLHFIISLKEHQEAHEHTETAPKFNDKYMVKTLNTIVDYLCGFLGESNIPLT